MAASYNEKTKAARQESDEKVIGGLNESSSLSVSMIWH